MNKRIKVISAIAELINTVSLPHPVRVGIDGVDCSGKTCLADELADALQSLDRKVIRISIDGFHNPEEIRYRQGRKSPEGFYQDTFNHKAIIASVLKSLGPDGNLQYKPRQFDFKSDTALEESWQKANPDSIVLFDGIFLYRPELLKYWDFTVFVDVTFDEIVHRAKERDQYLFGSPDDVESIYRERYVPGQKIYLESVNPGQKADIVIDNNDVLNPVMKKI